MIDLDDLELVARMADKGGRPWAMSPPCPATATTPEGYPQTIVRQGDAVFVAECCEGVDTFPVPTFARFIETFDPPTRPSSRPSRSPDRGRV